MRSLHPGAGSQGQASWRCGEGPAAIEVAEVGKGSQELVHGRISGKHLAPENMQALQGQRLRTIRRKRLAEVVLPLDIILKTRLVDQYHTLAIITTRTDIAGVCQDICSGC